MHPPKLKLSYFSFLEMSVGRDRCVELSFRFFSVFSEGDTESRNENGKLLLPL